ncbi:MAG: hypothetical protein QG608_2082 [Actinomycetota bacterium]|nr:hypothetical protein [Actinomycetota bacterium]
MQTRTDAVEGADPVPSADPVPNADPDSATDPGSVSNNVDAGLLEAGWIPPRRWNRTSVLLALGLALVLTFAAGTAAQRQWGSASEGGNGRGTQAGISRSAGQGGQFPAGIGSGRGGDTSTGEGASPSSAASGDGTAGDGTNGGQGTDDTAPAVVGKVVSVSPTQMKVENFGGTTVTVTVGPDVPVTSTGLTGIETGATVSVHGTVGSDGRITAKAVVKRSTGAQ